MLNNRSPLLAEPIWIPTSVHLPKDGQSVFVKARYNDEPRAVIFRRGPAACWEDRYSIYQFDYFQEWAARHEAAAA
jgi:hypothetical protein